MPLRSVCVFCASNPGLDPTYLASARDFGGVLARRGVRLVFGGGRVGLMGALADGALDAGGEVVGVMPHALVAREIAHQGLTQLHVVTSMHERKARMAELSDGFIALPGGLGTLEELFEVWTWGQLGLHAKPYGLLDVNGFFAPLLVMLDHLVAQRFVREEHRALLSVDTDGERLLERMACLPLPPITRLLQPEET